MSGILVVAETRRGELRDISLELIAAGLGVKDAAGGRLAVAVIGSSSDGLGADGVDEVLTVAAPVEHFEAHVAQAALEQLIEDEQPDLVLLGHTIDSMGFGPAVAARGGLGFASDVMEVGWDGDGPLARRGAYGDKLVAELGFPGKERTLMMVRPGSYEPVMAGGSPPPVRAVEVSVDPGVIASEHVEFREADVGDVDITKADFLLSVGRGIEDKDSIPQFEALAERMGATLSVSRPLVDAGWMSNARQVGQSGKTVKPAVYLALGISGAVQHLAGMQKAQTIIAVNSDPEAPIFGVAHFGAVADLFDVAEQLEQHFE
ncbi:MAG: electron transfer flavoprotein subunit alpha/FixB family protein [Solirubrobacterales bacterium]|nr:electron transfer flavoprotein subunit alpha/FixB family protein [Solirubrobacterales bacterium]